MSWLGWSTLRLQKVNRRMGRCCYICRNMQTFMRIEQFPTRIEVSLGQDRSRCCRRSPFTAHTAGPLPLGLHGGFQGRSDRPGDNIGDPRRPSTDQVLPLVPHL
jgi:hypothetical protein